MPRWVRGLSFPITQAALASMAADLLDPSVLNETLAHATEPSTD